MTVSDLNVTEGEWKVSFSGEGTPYFEGAITSGEHDLAIITGLNYGCVFGGHKGDYSSDNYEVEDIEQHKANAYLFAQAKNMYEMLSYLNAIFYSEHGSVTILDVDKIDKLLNACKPPKE